MHDEDGTLIEPDMGESDGSGENTDNASTEASEEAGSTEDTAGSDSRIPAGVRTVLRKLMSNRLFPVCVISIAALRLFLLTRGKSKKS